MHLYPQGENESSRGNLSLFMISQEEAKNREKLLSCTFAVRLRASDGACDFFKRSA